MPPAVQGRAVWRCENKARDWARNLCPKVGPQSWEPTLAPGAWHSPVGELVRAAGEPQHHVKVVGMLGGAGVGGAGVGGAGVGGAGVC